VQEFSPFGGVLLGGASTQHPMSSLRRSLLDTQNKVRVHSARKGMWAPMLSLSHLFYFFLVSGCKDFLFFTLEKSNHVAQQ